MERDEYRRLYELEDRLWWFRGMGRISDALIERYVDNPRNLEILDAGCGTGGMLGTLGTRGRVTGLDRSAEALRFARRRPEARLVQGSVERLPFAEESFDLVTSFDVLYHLDVSDDRRALRELRRVLRPGGTLVLRVPAGEALRSRHDEAVHTRERYGRAELVEKLEASGLEPKLVSHANCLLFPLAAVRRLAERAFASKRAGSEVEPVGPVLNRALLLPLLIEARLLRHMRLPFGLSLVAVATR